jgi:8-oxo-dGTP pyrophosphatase MutT (NUDIX family)
MSDLGDAALVLPLTPRNSIILVKQFMQASEVVTIEIPGGRVESSQSPQECAASELLEETGHVARELVLLGEMRASTRQSRNKHYLYLGLDCHQNGLQRLDALEAIEVVEVDVAEFFQLLAEGKICDSATLAATALAISKGYLDPPS